ncbi:hypothetical protein PUNSTDRAFT_118336 [Punctularia strigosozonata HHB-11173 SS5]|uniref:uncharacterized protein n=1 Tax=Punctularia strigosozonata (strain HHB-11173) TaxID=741275 RepID=UPI000441806A|nr:uncharacterized protein PUNSTDRAFT_118336 [Punctularia strigosozonata HHB-11173 SS5]EIN12541.1 hypothetical protein PUNSTDRAFT_118336 [Punctularia strigosozonata HHB-11173 SS5]
MVDIPEYQETTSLTFEWTLKGLKQIFETSKGEAKAKVIKSAKFDKGRWQVVLLGTSVLPSALKTFESQGWVSIYLSCEPTPEELELGVDGRWTRQGIYNFQFILKTLGPKAQIFNTKEAHSHRFSSKTANWGWAQFARRDLVFYNCSAVKSADAFVIQCNITGTPSAPLSSPPPGKFVPPSILDAVGSLLDDPKYSDIEFVLPKRGGTKRIYAAKRLLQRADYFRAMFDSGFSEGLPVDAVSRTTPRASLSNETEVAEEPSIFRSFDDSDEEDEDDADYEGLEHDSDQNAELDTFRPAPGSSQEVMQGLVPSPAPSETTEMNASDLMVESPAAAQDHDGTAPATKEEERSEVAARTDSRIPVQEEELQTYRNVRPKLDHPSSPRSRGLVMSVPTDGNAHNSPESGFKAPHQRIVVRDVAYNTYKAVLYYVYTDTIKFAPLSSSFINTSLPPADAASFRPATHRPSGTAEVSANGTGTGPGAPRHTQPSDGQRSGDVSRKDWIAKWMKNHPDRPTPCSAKSVYRLADRLDMLELKERAFQHIAKSLTIDNVPHEVFSNFSATFSQVRKVEVNYFLEHWAEIRSSPAMRSVWQQMRMGRHPGFEEVWPTIALSLEFRPRKGEGASDDERDNSVADI